MVNYVGNTPNSYSGTAYVGNTPNSYSGTAIYCNNIDISKLSKEEREEYLKRLPSVNYSAPSVCYPPCYYTNNLANQNVKKKRVTVLTDELIKSLDQTLECNSPDLRREAANMIVKLFDEDPTRHGDKALNALMNKMLINPYDKIVRDHALTLIQTEMAGGDENTKAILNELKRDPDRYNVIERHIREIDSALLHLSADSTVVNTPVS